jgi:hypothetical protein
MFSGFPTASDAPEISFTIAGFSHSVSSGAVNGWLAVLKGYGEQIIRIRTEGTRNGTWVWRVPSQGSDSLAVGRYVQVVYEGVASVHTQAVDETVLFPAFKRKGVDELTARYDPILPDLFHSYIPANPDGLRTRSRTGFYSRNIV